MFPSLVQSFSGLLARSERVRIARTDAERRAIYRMRYRIYVDELNYPVSTADRERRELHSPEDDLPESTLYYTGAMGEPTASVRVRVWGPGQIPDEIFEQFSLAQFPDIKTRTVCQTSMLMARSNLRGKGRAVALIVGSARQTVQRHRPDAMIASCVPALLPGYLRLGLRPYGGRLFSSVGSMDIPLIGILRDLEHMRRVGSPFLPAFLELAARGEYPTRDATALLSAVSGAGIETDPARVIAEVEALGFPGRSSFLSDLPAPTRRRLLGAAMTMVVPAGVEVFEPGVVNRDLFVLMEGEVESHAGGAPPVRWMPGEIFGERAFLLDDGRHQSLVRTRARCKLLHLRHGALRRITSERPEDASALYAALARAMARRASLAASPRPSADERAVPSNAHRRRA